MQRAEILVKKVDYKAHRFSPCRDIAARYECIPIIFVDEDSKAVALRSRFPCPLQTLLEVKSGFGSVFGSPTYMTT